MSAASIANARVFRQLMKAAREVGESTEIGNPEGLNKYVSHRFRVVAEANRKARLRPAETKRHRAMVLQYATAMKESIGDEPLSNILNALAAGVGSSVYKRTLEKGFFDLIVFRKRSAERGEADEEETEQRQNRILQAALAPIAEKLAYLHRGLSLPELRNAMASSKVGTSVLAISHGASEVAVEIDDELNKQTIFVKVDDDEYVKVMMKHGELEYERLLSASGEQPHNDAEVKRWLRKDNNRNGDDDAFDGNDEVSSSSSSGGPSTANLRGGSSEDAAAEAEAHDSEFAEANDRVEVCESDLVRGTTLHAYWNSVASRLLDAIVQELPIHRSRSTVLAGHGVGGAVALVLALQLHTMGYEVKNVMQFGSPRIIQDTLNRYVDATNPIRVVITGDPVTHGPATTSEGESFVHVGEVLMLDPSPEAAAEFEERVRESDADEEDEYGSNAAKNEVHGDEEDDDITNAMFYGEEEGSQKKMKKGSSSASSATSFTTSSRNYSKRFHIDRYVELLQRSDTGVVYGEGDESFMHPEWKYAGRQALKGDLPSGAGRNGPQTYER